MTTNHTYFEVMCALAASGQLTKTEHAELREHSEHCVLCRNRLVEMRQSGFQLFLARAFKTPSKRLPKGMQERFAARAISEGIPLSSRSAGIGFQCTRDGDRAAAGLVAGGSNSPGWSVHKICCRNGRGRYLACFRIPRISRKISRKAFRTIRFRGGSSQPCSRSAESISFIAGFPRNRAQTTIPADPVARQGRQFHLHSVFAKPWNARFSFPDNHKPA